MWDTPRTLVVWSQGPAWFCWVDPLLRKSIPKSSRTSTRTVSTGRKLEHALQLVDRADFAAAKQALSRLLQAHPGDIRVLFQLVQLAKARPATKDYHLATYNYLSTVLPTGSISKDTLSVIRDYWGCAAPGPRIQGQLLAKLINKLIAVGEFGLAEEICDSAEVHGLLDADALREANS